MKNLLLKLVMLASVLLCGCGREESNGAAFKKLLAERIRLSDEIRITEISDPSDFSGAGLELDGDRPEYEYGTVLLSKPQKDALLKAVETMDDRPQEAFAACFNPHHRMTMTASDGKESTITICFDCRGIRWEEASGLTKPEALYSMLETMVKSAGMDLEKDWSKIAKERFSQQQAQDQEAEAMKAHRTRLAETVLLADSAEVMLLDGMGWDTDIPAEKKDSYFPILPDGKFAEIRQQKVLTGEALEKCREATAELLLEEDGGGGMMCHYPIHAVRLWRGKELLFETSLCWACANFYLADPGKSTASFVGMSGKSLNSLLIEQVPIPESSTGRPGK